MIFLNTNIKNLKFKTPFLNTSGVWCTSEKEIEAVLKSQAAGVVFKTMTLEKREGNLEPRLFWNQDFSINSMGLPNLGVDYYCQIALRLKKYGKPMIASFAGFKEKEFYQLIEKLEKAPFSAVEVNLSCPNLEGKGIFAYDLALSFKILKNLRLKTKKILGVKLPPYFDRDTITIMAEKLIELKIDYVSLINSYPLGTAIDWKNEKMMIKPNIGVGGLGGKVLKPISLAQVILFHQILKDKVAIIGVGGVEKGSDVYEYILAGARAVGVGTALMQTGPKIFEQLKKEMEKILKEKKVKNIKEKVGKVEFL